MTFRFLRLVTSALVVSSVAAACSSKAPATDAYVSAQVIGGPNCLVEDQGLFLIGSDTTDGGGISSNPTRVQTGTNQGGTVTITCSVKASGSNYNIELSALLDSQQAGAGGSLTITGTVDSTMGAQSDISATFVGGGNTYEESDCSISYPANPPGGPVQPGRIWGSISCPNATEAGKVTSSGQAVSCQLSALFVFENCAT
ncbi:MAG TPA: hypothetical protein VEK07_13385 [Polyangiaceae bacterium]|nr:hypothetical protein [Polyangiaceae bacterium]